MEPAIAAADMVVLSENTPTKVRGIGADLSRLPVVEPGLAAVVARCRGRNLHFSTAVEPAIAAADMVFLSVHTPTKAHGIGAGQASDLRRIEAALR